MRIVKESVEIWPNEVCDSFVGNRDWDMRYFEGSFFHGHKGKSLFNLICYSSNVGSWFGLETILASFNS